MSVNVTVVHHLDGGRDSMHVAGLDGVTVEVVDDTGVTPSLRVGPVSILGDFDLLDEFVAARAVDVAEFPDQFQTIGRIQLWASPRVLARIWADAGREINRARQRNHPTGGAS